MLMVQSYNLTQKKAAVSVVIAGKAAFFGSI